MSLWDEIKKGYTTELEKYWNKYRQGRELNSTLIETIDKLTHTIKSIDTIAAMENAGYSYDDYHTGYSNARRRDSMGRFSNDDHDMRYRDNRSYGYSRDNAKGELMEHLHGLMNNAEDDHTRSMIHKWIDQAEREGIY